MTHLDFPVMLQSRFCAPSAQEVRKTIKNRKGVNEVGARVRISHEVVEDRLNGSEILAIVTKALSITQRENEGRCKPPAVLGPVPGHSRKICKEPYGLGVLHFLVRANNWREK